MCVNFSVCVCVCVMFVYMSVCVCVCLAMSMITLLSIFTPLQESDVLQNFPKKSMIYL